ncbi:DNA recombination protein RmuC [Anaerotignum faecicola]|nr:DNA recombination protein RmuC [Anaerotignum faecicola]
MDYIIIGLLIAAIICIILVLAAVKKNNGNSEIERLEGIKRDIGESQRILRQELSDTTHRSISVLGDTVAAREKEANDAQTEKIEAMNKSISEKQIAFQNAVNAQLSRQEERFKTFAVENEQKLEAIRSAVEKRLELIQRDNNSKLEQMRVTVDEKLQHTLEERMTQSFKLVNDRLEQVYKGLGEMQTLAVGVGDLKKVLSNVKSRGILGEIQLGAILEEILSPEQYMVNVATKKGSKNVVEFAVKIPTEDDNIIFLPIDSKFPGDTYGALRDAYESGNKDEIDNCAKQLISTIKSEAKDIRDKYIDPPNTTEFAIMFLPFEGLYSEVVNRGMVETLQREYKVNIAGPSTMAALLNSLQMGFRTFAIQKRSTEVWKVLGAVKTEFDKFDKVLADTQKRIEQANNELDKLIGTRSRLIRSKLKNVESLTELEAKAVLGTDDTIIDEE